MKKEILWSVKRRWMTDGETDWLADQITNDDQ